MHLDRGPMLTSALLSVSEVYFDICCPTSNPAVKHCHLVFHTSQVKSFYTFTLKASPLSCVPYYFSQKKKPNGFKVNKK